MKKIISIWDKDYIRCSRDSNLLLWLPMVSCVVMIALKLNSLYIDEEGGCFKGKNENSKKDIYKNVLVYWKKNPNIVCYKIINIIWWNDIKCGFVLFSLFSQKMSQTHTFVWYMYYDFDFKIYKSKKNCPPTLEMWHL